MTVKQLKSLLDGVDESLDVMICYDDTFDFVLTEESGVITFGEPCDEQGNPLDIPDFPDDITVFALIGSTISTDVPETEA